MVPGLVRYLEDLSLHLRLDSRREGRIIREMYSHLEDRVLDLEREGLSREQAVQEATRGFGKPQAVAQEMYRVHSTGSWADALLAATPHVGVFLLFALQLWQSFAWLAAFLTASVAVTLIGWWRGKPQWMYPWAGYSLALPLVSGMIAAVAVGRGGWGMLHGQALALPLWMYAGLLAYIPLSLWMLLSAVRRVIRRDWTFASLMILPFPILVRWILSLQVEGSALVYGRPAFAPEADTAIALVFLCLAAMPILFVRLNQRRLKIAALVAATPPSFIVAAANMPGSWGVPWLLLFSLVPVLFLLAPALVDMKLGRGSSHYHASLERRIEGTLGEA